jgi:hypothetical protein
MPDPLDSRPASNRGTPALAPRPAGILAADLPRTPDAASAAEPTASQPSEWPKPDEHRTDAIGLADGGDLAGLALEEIDIAQLQDDPLVDGGDFGGRPTDVSDTAPSQADPTGEVTPPHPPAEPVRGKGEEEAREERLAERERQLVTETEWLAAQWLAAQQKLSAEHGDWLAAQEERLAAQKREQNKRLAEEAKQLAAWEEKLAEEEGRLAAERQEQEQQFAVRAERLATREKESAEKGRCLAAERREQEQRLAARREELATREMKFTEAESRLAAESRVQEQRLAAREQELTAREHQLAIQWREQEEWCAAERQRQNEEELAKEREAQRQREERKRRWDERKRKALRWGEEQSLATLVVLISVARWLLRNADGVLRGFTRKRRDVRVRRALVPARWWGRKAGRALGGWSSRLATLDEAGMRRCLWLVSAIVLVLVLLVGALLVNGW